MVLRADLQLLAGLVPEGSRVLDLGCGDGALLAHLFRTRACVGTGVEKDPEQVIAAIGHRVPVIELDLDHQLGEFADSSYDVVVLSRTLQTVHQPEQLLSEMARIGHRLVVSMPNFGLWRHRLRLLTGRMPVNKDLPYHWYDTPNLRMSSLYELELLFDRLGLVVERRVPLAEDARASWFSGLRPNLTAGAAIYVLHSQRWHADESLNPLSDPPPQ